MVDFWMIDSLNRISAISVLLLVEYTSSLLTIVGLAILTSIYYLIFSCDHGHTCVLPRRI